MRAMVADAAGLALRDVPVPVPGPQQVLVRVSAAGLNRAELSMASGARHGGRGGPGTVAGLEWSGVVAGIGTEVASVSPGQRVMCTGSGGYAEFAVTDWGRVLPVPDGMDDVTAASLPTALQTAHNALAQLGCLVPGEAVLVHGASSGVGLMAMMVARELGAGLVIGTSTHAGRRAGLAAFGAGLAVDSSRPNWSAAVLDATDGRGAALSVDLVAGQGVNEALRATALLGRLINNGRLAGDVGEFDFNLHATRRITYIGSSFRTRTPEEVRAITGRMQAALWPALLAGRLRLPVDSTFPLERAAEAQARMRANQHFGKIVLTI